MLDIRLNEQCMLIFSIYLSPIIKVTHETVLEHIIYIVDPNSTSLSYKEN